MASTHFRPMVAEDALTIQRQATQRMQLGIERDMTGDEAEALASGDGEAWTAERSGRIVAIVGLRHTFPPVQAVAWAILAEGLGAAHLTVSRFARARIATSGLLRIEAICRAGEHAQALAGAPMSNGRLLAAALEKPSAETRWARLLGLFPAHMLRNFGARSELHILFERIS